MCVRLTPVGSVDMALLDIKLTAKSKMLLQHYTYVGLVTISVIYLTSKSLRSHGNHVLSKKESIQ